MSQSVGIVLLAAGASVRMGRPKQLLAFQGRTLLRHAAETALTTACRPIVAVLGAEAESSASELAGLAVYPVIHAGWAAGMGTSIAAGVAALTNFEPQISAAVLMLCDQPLVTPAVLERLVTAHSRDGWDRSACFYGGKLGVPALFASSWFPQLQVLRGGGASRLLNESAGDVFAVPFPAAETDLDTPGEYESLLKRSDTEPNG